MREDVQIKVSEPDAVGDVSRYRLLTANGMLFIRSFNTIDELYSHVRWLIECGVMAERLRIEEVRGTMYIREIEISKVI